MWRHVLRAEQGFAVACDNKSNRQFAKHTKIILMSALSAPNCALGIQKSIRSGIRSLCSNFLKNKPVHALYQGKSSINTIHHIPKNSISSKTIIPRAASTNLSTMASSTNDRTDPSSFSNSTAARVTHSDFEIDVNFDTHVMTWWAKHTVRIEKDGASELILDTRDLNISSVTVNGSLSSYTDGKSTKALGTSIVIPLPSGLKTGAEVPVELQWTTSPTAVAAQWLAPEQTAGGKHPFLFTQCQAIHARSLCPCQDTPGAKFTYTAAVRVPGELVALMSALAVEDSDASTTELPHIPPSKTSNDASTKVFRFQQPLPISSYLLALAVGDLVSKDLSPVSRVWSEPATVEAAAYEFEDTPKYLEAAESLAGPYRWGRYDLLLLPPSFPYGRLGMAIRIYIKLV